MNALVGNPIRVQLSRRKGWRMPTNTVKVCRPGKWGNPFRVCDGRDEEEAVNAFEWWIREQGGKSLLADLHELKGKNLACWCPLGEPCHADVLLELANASGEGRPHAAGKDDGHEQQT
jgi:hypothetical protein